MLFGFQRLVQAFRITAAGHHSSGEFIDDDDLVTLHDVIAVTLKEFVSAKRLIDVMNDGNIFDVVERNTLEQVCRPQDLLHFFHTDFGQRNGALLLVDLGVGPSRVGA